MTVAAQILIVEDEQIVAADIRQTLQQLGYVVPDVLDTGEAAIRVTEQLKPDLVLMDIRLRGSMDGITTANVIRDRWNIPVVYLTAHADRATLERAKISEPFGYVLKPFEERELHATVEMALYKHRLDRQLRDSQRWLSVTLNSIGDGVIATDPQGRVVFINSIAQRLIKCTSEQAVGRPLGEVFNIIDEYTREPAEDPVSRVIASGMVVGLGNHTLLISTDGTEQPIDDSAAPIKDAGGELQGVVLVFRDVTERRQSEAELRASEKRFRTLTSHAPVGIFQTDANGDCVFVNERWCEMAGITPEQAQGKGWGRALHPLDRERVIERWSAVTEAGETFADEYRFLAPDGRVTWLSGSAITIRDHKGEITGYIGTVTDITQRKQSEETLRSLQNELRIVTDSMSARVVRCSRDLRYLWASRHYAEWLNTTAEQIVHRPIIEVLGEQVFTRLLPYFERALAGESVTFVEELEFLRIGRRWIDAVYTPTRDASGEVDGWVGVVADVTEQRRLENALKESDRRKDEFLAILAHELRNPLAPIKSSVAVLKTIQRPDPALLASRDIIDRQVQHMARLLDDLLDVNRITSGKLELRKERVALAGILETAVETSRPLIQTKGHALSISVPDQPIQVYADRVRLAQVFCNLLNNAAKYTDHGGKIELNVAVKDHEVSITIRDNGIGIAAETMSRLFEIFSQISPALERSEGGLGVGLYLVKGLVELHCGTISVNSTGLGQGCEFVVRLPIANSNDPQSSATRRPKSKAEPLVKRRLLIVDDLKDSADSLADLLRVLGHEAQTAYDGEQAVMLARELQPDVLLLDIGMPKLNGYEACRRIREQPWGRNMFVIAVTGWGQDNDRRRTTEAGFDYHLVKPIDASELMKLLASLPSKNK